MASSPAAACSLPTRTAPSLDAEPADEAGLRRLRRRRRRRCICICALVTLGVLLLLGVTLLVLFLTVFRVRDPTTRLLSTRFVGLAPSLTQPNFTLLLTVAVHNPNPASFSYASGTTGLWYRGAHVGDAQVDPGRIPSKGDGVVQLEMTVLTAGFTKDMAQLIRDIEAGSLPLDASARIPGRVAVLGVLKLNVVAYSDCHIVVGFPDMEIRGQDCRDHAKL
ncbi:hypothetical protein CFC21_102595 [Triticum aestivum]|uniref:Late embryogenesis abundant protein LEA-2 subgroup domain-containing protein n=2 Tax=Triticum aestivum TaxID=4565 RepID=A0A9R1N5A8_WHEAT|nr:uncharacterized protein LOC119338839 [Triticum dicoccoides]XP_044436415.1 uncharacterized protein LOC123162706 [Triticum aestivum]KAF7101204.1 hypothetical protein CFC21_102595 [Triticum aestivum]